MIYYRQSSSSNPKNLIGGFWVNLNDNYFNGKIDELAIFNTALDLDQVKTLADSKDLL